MKHRPNPSPIRPGRLPKRLRYDRQVQAWAKRLAGNEEVVINEDLSEEQLAYLMSEVHRRRGDFNATLYERAMAKLTPVLAAPEMDDPIGDLEHVFAQPEVLECWKQISGQRGERGPAPSWGWTKALTSLLAMTGRSTHVDDTLHDLSRSEDLQELFTRVELAAGGPGLGRMPSYPTVCRLMPRLAGPMRKDIIRGNIELMKALREMHPDAGIGKRLLVDGTAIPAWAPQVGCGSSTDEDERSEREARLREFAPDAGFRAIYYGSTGKRSIKPGDTLASGLRAGRGKAWRGYILVVVADQATGLPLAWNLQDAQENEHWGLIPCLSDLYNAWPDIGAECIAGDGEYNNDETVRMCEVNYGLHPCFRDNATRESAAVEREHCRDNTIASIGKNGELICATHKKPLTFESFDTPTRAGLRPGQPSDGRRFRVRALCTHSNEKHGPCGRVSLKAEADWSRLTLFPLYSQGNPKRRAYRQAMIDRLNGVEQLFQRLKGGKKLGTVGTDRSRIRELEKHEAMISLAFLSMTALTVADQRQQRGDGRELPTLEQLQQACSAAA